MAYTEVQICNIALGYLGVEKRISSRTEESKEARLCAQYFDHARDLVLEETEWPFAQKYETLALIQEEPNEEWPYEYRVPADCLRAIRIVPGSAIRNEAVPVPFTTSYDGGPTLWTDRNPVQLQYTARITDPVYWSPSFAEALAWKLAVMVAMPMAIKETLRDRAEAHYTIAIHAAASHSLNSVVQDEVPDGEFVRARS